MARFLLDTNVIIDYSRGREPSHSLVSTLIQSNDQIGTYSIVIGEFFSGLTPAHYPVWRQFFSALEHWLIDGLVGEQAGRFRYTYARRGIVLALPDTLIASVAIAENAILVTTNDRDFPMAGINLLVP